MIDNYCISFSSSLSLRQRLAFSQFELGSMLVFCCARVRVRWLFPHQRILGPIGGFWCAPAMMAVYQYCIFINRIVMLLENLIVPNE